MKNKLLKDNLILEGGVGTLISATFFGIAKRNMCRLKEGDFLWKLLSHDALLVIYQQVIKFKRKINSLDSFKEEVFLFFSFKSYQFHTVLTKIVGDIGFEALKSLFYNTV